MEWEYITVITNKNIMKYYSLRLHGESSEDNLDKILNEHGKQGWELASTTTDGFHILLVFKRPKKSQQGK